MSIKVNGTEITAVNVNGTAVETVRVRASASSEYVVVFTAAGPETFYTFTGSVTDIPSMTSGAANIAQIYPSNESSFITRIQEQFFQDTSPRSYCILSDSLVADLSSVKVDDMTEWVEFAENQMGIDQYHDLIAQYPDLLKFPIPNVNTGWTFFTTRAPRYVTIDFMKLNLPFGEEGTLAQILCSSTNTYITQGNAYKKQMGIIDHAFYGYDPNNEVASGSIQPSAVTLPTNFLDMYNDLSSSNFVCIPICIRDVDVEMYESNWRSVVVSDDSDGGLSAVVSFMSEFTSYTSQFPNLKIFVPILCDDTTNQAKLTQLADKIEAMLQDYSVGNVQKEIGLEVYDAADDAVRRLVAAGDSYRCLIKQVPFSTNTRLGYTKNYLRNLCDAICETLGASDNNGYFLIVDDQENEIVQKAMYANPSNHIYFAEWLEMLISNVELPCYTLCNEPIAKPYTVGRAFGGGITFLGMIPTIQMIAANNQDEYAQFLAKYPNEGGIPSESQGITYAYSMTVCGCYYG